MPISDAREPTAVDAPEQPGRPFARLMDKLGLTDADLQAARDDLSDREAYMPHREFEAHSDAEGKTRYRDPTDCAGVLRIEDDSGPLWTMECDACGFLVSVAMHRADPDRQLEHVLSKAGIPDVFIGRTWDDREAASQGDTLRACREWIAGFKREPLPAVGLFGLPGRGKSHLLTLILQSLAKKFGTQVMYRSELELFDQLQAGMDIGSYEIAWQRVLRAPVLALDDLGAGRKTEWKQERRMALIDHRYAKELPTIFATNLPPGAWDERFGPRTASRLRGMCCVLHLQGPDRRAQGVQESMAVGS
jgi:hypothetical protein